MEGDSQSPCTSYAPAHSHTERTHTHYIHTNTVKSPLMHVFFTMDLALSLEGGLG